MGGGEVKGGRGEGWREEEGESECRWIDVGCRRGDKHVDERL